MIRFDWKGEVKTATVTTTRAGWIYLRRGPKSYAVPSSKYLGLVHRPGT